MRETNRQEKVDTQLVNERECHLSIENVTLLDIYTARVAFSFFGKGENVMAAVLPKLGQPPVRHLDVNNKNQPER